MKKCNHEKGDKVCFDCNSVLDKAQHTPIPWKQVQIDESFKSDMPGGVCIVSDGDFVCDCADLKTAGEIVAAVNFHEALVADLRQAIEYIKEHSDTVQNPYFIRHALETIAKAESK